MTLKIDIPRSELIRHVEEQVSLAVTAKRLGCSPVTVFHALEKAGLKSRGRFKAKLNPKCCKCGCTDPDQFNKRKGKQYTGNKNGVWCAWCRGCYHDVSRELKRENRRKIIEQLGGKCLLCGFDKYSSALDVHHADPGKKHFSFNNILGWSWPRIEKEIAGCVLLCANCHRGYHSGEVVFKVFIQ